MIRARLLLPLALVLAIALPAAAGAATVREYQLQYAPTGDSAGALLIVSAIVDPSQPLPIEVTVPVPAGASVLWAGEVLGGDPSLDPAREVTSERVGEMDVYTMTLEQSRLAQLEVQLPRPTVSGSRVEATLTWTNPGEEVLVWGAVVTEPGASAVDVTPERVGDVQHNNIGESLYPLSSMRLATGESYVIDVAWRRGAPAGGGAEQDSRVLPLLLGILVLAIVILVVVIVREQTRARRAALAHGDDLGSGLPRAERFGEPDDLE